MFTIEVLPAQRGDCLWLTYGEPGDLHHVIVDAGPQDTISTLVPMLEERIRGLARGILAQAFERDAFDWVDAVAAEIPMWVFSEIMGLPVEDRRLIIELGDKILGNTDPEVV